MTTTGASPQASFNLAPASLPGFGFAQNIPSQMRQPSSTRQRTGNYRALEPKTLDVTLSHGSSSTGKQQEAIASQIEAMDNQFHRQARGATETAKTVLDEMQARQQQHQPYPRPFIRTPHAERNAAMVNSQGNRFELPGIESIAGAAIFNDASNGNTQPTTSASIIPISVMEPSLRGQLSPPNLPHTQSQQSPQLAQETTGLPQPLSRSDGIQGSENRSRAQVLNDIPSSTRGPNSQSVIDLTGPIQTSRTTISAVLNDIPSSTLSNNSQSVIDLTSPVQPSRTTILAPSLASQPGPLATSQAPVRIAAQLAQQISPRVLSHEQLISRILETLQVKKMLELRLDVMRTHSDQSARNEDVDQPNASKTVQIDSMKERLSERVKRSQELFAFAGAQLLHELGTDLTDDEKELIDQRHLRSRDGPGTEEQTRDDHLIESFKLHSLMLELSHCTTTAEDERAAQRKEQREKQNEEPATLPHKPAYTSPISQPSPRQPPQSWARGASAEMNNPECPLPGTPQPSTVGVTRPGQASHEPSARMQDPHNAPPGPPPLARPEYAQQGPTSPGPPPTPRPHNLTAPGLPPSPSPQMSNPLVPPPSDPLLSPGHNPYPNSAPAPPPGSPPGAPPPPHQAVISRPGPSPPNVRLPNLPNLPNQFPSSNPNQASGAALRTGTMVNQSFTSEGQTNLTITTNPDCEERNEVCFMTQTVKRGDAVKTSTNTTLRPLTANGVETGNGDGRKELFCRPEREWW